MNHGDQRFEIIINVLVSSFCFICISMVSFYGLYNLLILTSKVSLRTERLINRWIQYFKGKSRTFLFWPIVYIYIYEYCFTSLSAESWQYRDRRKPEAGAMPYSYFEWLQGIFIVHSTIGRTVHYMPLNSLEHCICTTTMTNIRPDRDSNLVTPGCKPQSIRMSHRGWHLSDCAITFEWLLLNVGVCIAFQILYIVVWTFFHI